MGSLFDGSGGFPLGGLMSGVTPVWASEIEPFPIRVTTKRLPFMKHYGDISQMDGGKIEPVDIICFGSPCTDMSVAGRRAGLDGKQSVLFYQAIRIITEMRCATNGKYPRWICWENVPGAFSSNSGRDFKAVLEAIIGIVEPGTEVPLPEKGGWPYADCYMGDEWSVAYRTLDSQHWGVAQRRKRIFLVGDLNGQCAGDVLFKSEGLSRYSPESFRAWQRATRSAENRTGTAGISLDGYNGSVSPVASTLGVNCGMSTGRNGVVLNDQGGNRMDVTHEVTATLRAEAHHPPLVMEAAGFCTEHSASSRGIGYEEEKAPTLRAGVVPAAIALDNHPADSRVGIDESGTVQTLTGRMGTGGGNVPMIMETDPTTGGRIRKADATSCNSVVQAYGISSHDSNAMKSPNPHSGIYEAETSRTLDANGGNPGCNQGGIAVVCVDQGAGKSSCSVSKELAPTLACTHGGEPVVCVKGGTFVIEGNGARPSHQGDGYKESDIMYTLNTVDRHAVYAMTTGSFTQVSKDTAPTVLARDYKDPTAVCYGIGRDTFNQGKNAKFAPTMAEETQPTLVAKGPGAVAIPHGFDPSTARDVGQYVLPNCGNTLVNGTCPGYHNGVVDSTYTVRRLTPTECSRLQGFPDWWCSDLDTEDPTEEEISFWADVWETHRRIVNPKVKPKSYNQLLKWIKHPHSDAAEYKMWGNGVALPCVFFVLAGIVWCTQNDPR